MLSLSEVQERLDPVNPIIEAAHLGAATRLVEVSAKFPMFVAALDATERANVMHGQIRSLVSVGVEALDDIKIPPLNFFAIAVRGDLLVRFKYLGYTGLPSNVFTEQQRLLKRQQYTDEAMALLAEAGISEPPTIVTCGHTMNGMDIGRISIRRDCAGHQPWSYDIYGGASVIEPQRFPGVEEANPAVVRSKRHLKQEGTEADNA